MTDKEIRAEAEKLKNDLAEAPNQSEIDLGRISAFEDVILFIDSHTEEPISEDLEEAAIESFKSNKEDLLSFRDYHTGYVDGAEWQKQKTIDKAVEWLYQQQLSVSNIDEFINDFKRYMEEEK